MTDKWESLEEDPREDIWETWPGAVLLDTEISYYAKHPTYPMISPFDEDNLKPARYLLTLGHEAVVGGETMHLSEEEPLIIAPHQVAIVRTREKLNLPRFLVARWNLTVGMVYTGLLWVGALQVDPGWVGYLPCPIYNLSNDKVVIKPGEPLFTIDFVRTTRFRSGHNLAYPNKTPVPTINPPIRSFDTHNIRSGPYEKLRDLEELQRFRNAAYGAIGLMFAVLAIMVAGLAVVAVKPAVDPDGPFLSFWPMTALFLSLTGCVLSVGVSFFAWNIWKRL